MALTVNYNEDGIPDGVPTYLFDQVELYHENPLEAGRVWFAHAHLGLSTLPRSPVWNQPSESKALAVSSSIL